MVKFLDNIDPMNKSKFQQLKISIIREILVYFTISSFKLPVL